MKIQYTIVIDMRPTFIFTFENQKDRREFLYNKDKMFWAEPTDDYTSYSPRSNVNGHILLITSGREDWRFHGAISFDGETIFCIQDMETSYTLYPV